MFGNRVIADNRDNRLAVEIGGAACLMTSLNLKCVTCYNRLSQTNVLRRNVLKYD